MDIELLILVAVAIIALPLLGNVLAMSLGLVTTLRRSHIEPNGRDSSNWLEPVETLLRRGALALGSGLASDESTTGRRWYLRSKARTAPDRRTIERRMSARRGHPREGSERRHAARRMDSQRRQMRRREKGSQPLDFLPGKSSQSLDC